MFEAHVALGAIRQTADGLAASWRIASARLAGGHPADGFFVTCNETMAALRQVDVHAVAEFIQEIGNAIGTSGPQPAVIDAIGVVERELENMAQGTLRATLHLHHHAEKFPRQDHRRDAGKGLFFLPALPQDPRTARWVVDEPLFRNAAKNYRNAYLRAMLEAARTPDIPSFAGVRQTLLTLEGKKPPLKWALLVSASIALLDALQDGGLTWENDVMRLLSRTDAALKLASLGPHDVNGAILSRLMYAIARAQPVSRRIELLQEEYGLGTLLDETDPPQMQRLRPDQFEIRWQLLVRAWEGFLAGNVAGEILAHATRKAWEEFRNDEGVGRFAQALSVLCDGLHNGRIERCKALDEHVSQLLARWYDTAMARNAKLLADAGAEELAIAQRIVADGGVNMVMRNDDVDAHISRTMAETAKEFVSAREAWLAQSPAGFAKAKTHLDAAVAALFVCGFEAVADYASRIQPFVEGDDPRIAEILTGLEQYCHVAVVNAGASAQLAQRIAAQLERLDAPTDSISETPEDRELFDIFVDEAMDIDTRCRELIAEARVKNGLAEPAAAIIRRGLHTLKGSARISGTNRLGEAAWIGENVFNTWLTLPGPYPAELTGFAELVHDRITAACNEMEQHGAAAIDLDELRHAAEGVEATAKELAALRIASSPAFEAWDAEGGPVAFEAKPAAEPPGPAPAAVASLRDTIDPDIYQAFRQEAAEAIAVIRSASADASSHGVSFSLVRAAHLLTGISRTAGLPVAEQIAYDIERWATSRHDAEQPPSQSEVGVVLAGLAQVETYLADVEAGATTASANLSLTKLLLSEHGDDLSAEDFVSRAHAAGQGEIATIAPTPVPVAHDSASEPATDSELGPDARLAHEMFEMAALAMPDQVDIERYETETDAETLSAFCFEAEAILQEIDATIADYQGPPSMTRINQLIHTLKGGARLAGAMSLGDRLHTIEDLTTIPSLPTGDVESLLHLVQNACDAVRLLVADLSRPTTDNDSAHIAAVTRVQTAAGDRGAVAAPSDNGFRVTTAQVDDLGTTLSETRTACIRVRRHVDVVAEAVAGAFQPAQRLAGLVALIALEAETKISAGQADQNGMFDALELDRFTTMHELTRKLTEAGADVVALLEQVSEAVPALADAGRAADNLAESSIARLEAVSRTSIDFLAPRLRATVRQAAADSGKEVAYEQPGSPAKMERLVIDRITPALEHILRNAVAHGIKDAAARAAAGKPKAGRVTLAVTRDGDHARIVIADDGVGIRIDEVRAKASAKELIPDSASDAEVLETLFLPGFSTADHVTQLAGRGIGLDAAREIIGSLGGSISIATTTGQGTQFTISVPLSTSYTSGLMLTVAGSSYIIASKAVEGVHVVSGQDLKSAYAGGTVSIADRRRRVLWLGALIGAKGTPQVFDLNKVVVAKGLDVVIHADNVELVERVMTKRFAPTISVPWVVGHTVLHDGRVAVVLNPTELHDIAAAAVTAGLPQADVGDLVMIVDDSRTVRKVTARLLQAQGYRVAEAVDGLEAIEMLGAGARPLCVLMDIEMPRMDGFTATKTIRFNPDTAHIPVIIISSRAVEKHIDHARAMGANHFLGKPYDEATLVRLLSEYREAARPARAA
jgi:chemotaxis protein histidine kinase CheA/CheY-like chemotaxis protein